jgi:hypothetical protein
MRIKGDSKNRESLNRIPVMPEVMMEGPAA